MVSNRNSDGMMNESDRQGGVRMRSECEKRKNYGNKIYVFTDWWQHSYTYTRITQCRSARCDVTFLT